MSHSFLSLLSAGVLLAGGAHAADVDEGAAAAPGAAHAKAPEPAGRSIVKIFVTMRDAAGKVLGKVNVRIEADEPPDIGVGPDGGKLSLPAGKDAAIKVLFPGGNCSVTLSPKLIAGGRVGIGVDRGASGHRCALEDPAQAGKPASAPTGRAAHPSSEIETSNSLF